MVEGMPTFHPQQDSLADESVAPLSADTQLPPPAPSPAPITDIRLASTASPPSPSAEWERVQTVSPSLSLYVARNPTGQPILAVGVSNFASTRPPLSQTATLSRHLEQLDLRQSTDDSGDESGVFLWLGRDPHPVDELSLPQHSQSYVSEVRIVESDAVDEWRLKGCQTVALSQSHHLALHFTSPAASARQQSPNSPSSDTLPQSTDTLGRGGGSSAAAMEDKRALVVGGWRVGDMIDALDTVNTWLEARVVDVNVKDELLYIHFDGWADKWNEWIPAKSKRLARYRTNTGLRGVDRPFNLKLEAHGLHATIARLKAIKATLEAKAAELEDDSASPLPASHAFYPLSAPLSTLLSAEEYHFLSAGDNFKYIGHVVNASVEVQNTHLLHDSIAFLQHNTTLLSYSLATEPTLQAGWCEMLARLMGGGPHHLYNAYGTKSDDSEVQVEELQPRSSGPNAASVQQADATKVVYAVREVIGKRSMQQQGMSAGLGVVNEKERGGGLMSVIIVSLLNRLGREGGFAALQKHFAQLQAQAQSQTASTSAAVATVVPPFTSASAVVNAPSAAATASAPAFTPPSSSTTSSTASLYPLAYLIRGLAAVRLVLEPSFSHSLVSSLSLPTVVRYQLHTITDDELKQLDRQVWRTVIQDCQSLLLTSTVSDVKGCIEFAETMNLHVALRMIQAQVLATRIDGIQQLDAYVVRASGTNAAQSTILTPAYLAGWLEDNRVVESLLGRDSHEQIVKRSPSILKFLATQHKLQSRHLELLYQAMQGKHEGVARIVYELLCDLASVLSEEMLDVVFGRLQEKPLTEYREFDLQVVKAFTLNAVRNRQEAALRDKEGASKEKEKVGKAGGKEEKERKWYGLSIFWDLIQDPTIAAPIASLASQSLASLLAQPDFKPQLSAYLDRCLSTLGGAKAADPLASNTVSALQLAQLIIQQQPEVATRGVNSRGDLIVSLESDRKVLSLLVDSIITYEKAALSGGASTTVTDDMVVAGHTHLTQLQTRFAFLSFLLHSSPPSRISLQQSHIDLLWSTFITPNCPPSDQSRLLNWLTSAVQDKDCKDQREVLILPTKLTRLIFRDYLCNAARFDYGSITMAGFECFESYFVFTGRETDALYTARRDNITVIQWRKLDGVDSLWQLVTLCKDKAVLTAASSLLTTLYLRLDMLAPQRDKRAYLKQFIDKCMAHIAAAVQGDSKQKIQQQKDTTKDKNKAKHSASTPLSLSSSQELTIYSDSTSFRLSSLVFLLDLFLIRLSRGDVMDRARYSSGAIVRATWKSQTKMFDARVKQVNRDGTYHLEYSDGDVDERTPERNLHPVNRDEAIAREKEKEREKERREHEARGLLINDEGDDSDAVYPRNLLAQSAHFDVLFRLLGQTNAMLGQQVSELLARMPVNAELAQHIRQLGAPEVTVDAKGKLAAPQPLPDWNALLPPSSVPKLLYTLRVIRSYAIPPNEDQSAATAANGEVDASRMGAQRWQEMFVSRGGFKHLYALLMMSDAKLDEWMADALAHKCLGMLLELMNAFLLLQSVRPTVLEAIDGVRLAARLLAVAQAAIQSASKEEPVPSPGTRQQSQPAASALRPGMMGPTLPVSTMPVLSRQASVPPAAVNPAHDLLGRLTRTSLLSLHALLQASPSLLTSALSSSAWDVLLSDGILSPLLSCRLSVNTSLLILCSSFAAVVSFCLPRLLARLPALDNTTASVVGQEYFVLLQKLIDKHKHTTATASDSSTTETQNGSTTTAPSPTSTPPIDSASTTQPRVNDGVQASLYDTVQLVSSINSKIAQQPIVEATHMQHDQMLLGFLSLIRLLLQGESPSTKQQLGGTLIPHMYTCLFDTPTSESRAAQVIQPPKFKAGKTRDMAFAILNELCVDCPPNALALTSQLLPFHYQGHTSQPDTKDWSFEPRVEEKSLTGYLGIANLGCICYINAPLQQLFMIPAFRSALLAIDTYKDGGEPFNPHESLLYQMQYLFGQLQESEQQAVSPLGLCHAFKDLDGKPTDVRVQDDSGGFVQKLLDRLCMSCKGTPFEHNIPRILGGELCHELIGRGDCTHYRDRSEEFYGLQVEVQNKRTLADSLSAFIEGEVLEGGNQYKCDSCNKKVDTLKRTCIRNLPPTLFFTLKRFQLDYNTMETIKLNDRLDFPHYIDMRPYCKVALPTPADRTNHTAKAAGEGKEEGEGKASEGRKVEEKKEAEEERGAEYYQYVLRGVVVHTGSANGGHYYSFIQERGESADEADGRWLKMNDSVVSFFDPADIPDECFGGVEEAPALSRGAANKDGQAQVFERYRNAYLVFYDRVKQPVDIKKANEAVAEKYNATVTPAPPSALSLAKGKAALTKSPSSTYLSALNGSSKVVRTTARLPPAMHDAIWAANMAYFRDKAVYDKSYFEFIHKLVVDCAVTPRRRKSTAITVLSYKPDTTTPTNAQTEVQPVAVAAAADNGSGDGLKAGDSLSARLTSLSLSDDDEYYRHQLTQLATRFFLTTFARSRNKELLAQWSIALRSLYERDVLSSAWLLHQFTINNGLWVSEYLWECTDQNVKRAVAELLCVAIGNVVPLAADAFREGAPRPVLWRDDQPLGAGIVWLSYIQSDESSYGVDVAVEFAHTLVQLLNFSAVHWRDFDHYFRVFSVLASSSSQCALWLLREHRLLGRLLDFFLCDASLYPALNQLPIDPHTGNRLMMRDMHSSPEWNNFIALTSTLIQHSKQPATLPITLPLHPTTPLPAQLNPYTDRTLADLSAEEMALLVYPDINNGFLVHLLQLAATRKKGQIVSGAICHLCRNNEALTQLLVQCIRRGLEWFDFDSIRSYFRVLTALVLLKDDLQAVRVAAIVSMLLEVIRAQLRFWKISDFCLDHLIRIAKLSPLALQYIHSHTSDLEPLLNFISTYPDPPTTTHRYQLQTTAAGVQLFKPREHYSVSRPQSAFEAYGMPTRTKLAVLESLMRGGEVDEAAGTGSDSDQDFSERVLEDGQWVDALDTASKWLCAQVVSVAGTKVLLRYSGWCFKPETKLLLADGGEIAAGDVVSRRVGADGTVTPGTVLLDEHGQPTPVTAVDRGYVEVQSADGDQVQRVPRANHPAKDMYSFELMGHDVPAPTVSHPPLIVSGDHIIELVNLMKPTVCVCNDNGNFSVHHSQLDPGTQFMSRKSYGYFATDEEANEFAAGLSYPLRWSPRASVFYAYLHSTIPDEDKRSWSMYQPSALSTAAQLQSVTPLAFTGVGRFRALVRQALQPMSNQQLTPQLLDRLAWLCGFWLANGESNHRQTTDEVSSIVQTVRAVLLDDTQSSQQRVELASEAPLSGFSWFARLLATLGVSGNKHVPMAVLADSVDIRRHCLAGLVDGNCHTEPETREYVVTCAPSANGIMDGIVHLARGLGYAVEGKRPIMYQTEVGERQLGYQCSILGVPDFTDPLGLPVVLSHNRIKAQQRIEPHTYSYSCVSPAKNNRILAAVVAVDSHEYVGITVPHGAMLSAESLVVHNSDKWNEWIEMNSTRIQKLGRKTSKKQIEERLRRPPTKEASPQGPIASPVHAR